MMRRFAQLMMVASVSACLMAFGVVAYATLKDETALLFEMLDLAEDLQQPPKWVHWAGLTILGILCASLMTCMLSLNGALAAVRARGFMVLSHKLARAGKALIVFYLALYVLTYFYPFMLLINVEPEARPELSWFGVDVDTVLVVIGVSLVAIGKSFADAAEIDAENKAFF